MLISCPYCGPRDVAEFIYQGDANRVRPNPKSQDIGAWNEYIYDRLNIAGDQNEFWLHSGGCRSHLFVVRNTLTHKISHVSLARDRLAPAAGAAPLKAATPARMPAAKRVAKPAPKTAKSRGAK